MFLGLTFGWTTEPLRMLLVDGQAVKSGEEHRDD
jgi:hypothetical protein